MKYVLPLAVALAFAGSANAATIVGLVNTGTGPGNVALVGGNGTVDPHYSVLSSTTPGVAGQQAQTYYNGAYLADDANSRWISLSGTGNPGSNTTVYRLTFDLTGLDAATAAITGNWGADNFGSILLNGVSTGNNLVGTTVENFNHLTAFSISSGFVAGINTLDFSITDTGNPTAFRVDDIAGTAEMASAVPEPATWGMLIAGFGMIGGALRRRQSVRVSFG